MSAACKLRVRYGKLGKIRFTSHRDTCNHWERALRVGQLPVAMSNGFTRRPKLSFGLGLPTGAESTAEYLDVEFTRVVEHCEFIELTAALLPTGYTVLAVADTDHSRPSLQEDVVACEWMIGVAGVTTHDLAAAVEVALAAPTLPVMRSRKGHQVLDDVRSGINDLHVTSFEGWSNPVLVAHLDTTGRGVRPGELLAAVLPGHDPLDCAARVLRTHQFIDRDGEWHDVVPLPTAESV
jgi:radical SAM-linked protein